jgi:hypothetical protein
MRKVKKYWMVLLLGGLLMATLVGVARARPNEGSQAGALSRRITIPAGHFIPTTDDYNYFNNGWFVYNLSGWANYSAPVVFPTGQAVVVESVTLYVYDNDSGDEICAGLIRADPTAANGLIMANACSSGASSTDPRHFTDSSISFNPVKHGNGIYLWLEIQDAGTSLKAYGVRIQYHHGTT